MRAAQARPHRASRAEESPVGCLHLKRIGGGTPAGDPSAPRSGGPTHPWGGCDAPDHNTRPLGKHKGERLPSRGAAPETEHLQN